MTTAFCLNNPIPDPKTHVLTIKAKYFTVSNENPTNLPSSIEIFQMQTTPNEDQANSPLVPTPNVFFEIELNPVLQRQYFDWVILNPPATRYFFLNEVPENFPAPHTECSCFYGRYHFLRQSLMTLVNFYVKC
jgi:hypothetical protein